MALSRSRLRSELPNTTETTRLLNKIKSLLASSPRHVVFKKGTFRSNAAALSQVVVDGNASNVVEFQQAPFSSVAGTLTIQDLTFTGAAGNATDNSVTIAYTTGGTAGSEVVSVTGSAISIQIESGVSTATQIKAAFDLVSGATALASCSISGTGSNAQTAPVTATALSGGITAASVEKYDVSALKIIKRLRTKKWLIEILSDAVSN